MDAAFSSIAFVEPARAEENLARLETRLPGTLFAALPVLLPQLPDPDSALNFLERYVSAAGEGVLGFLKRKPAALHHLLVVFSYSRFLSETLIQQPELVHWLHRPGPQGSLERIKSPEDLHEEFARFEAVALDQPASIVLGRFKRREYLRIMLRDVLELATLAETTIELSQLADVLLDRTLRVCTQRLTNDFGAPQYTDAQGHLHSTQLTVISLGKLGASELNYNSDVDLMFLYRADGETSGGTRGSISNHEFFVRLAQQVLRIITEPTPEGTVYRVDLRLRPQGAEGDLAVSLPAAIEYYRTRAREWELQMLIKARASAGDAATLHEFLAAVRPRVFPPGGTLNPAAVAAVEAVLNARQEITRELQRRAGRQGGTEHSAERNVKLSPGGIRDIEFLAQCLQRVHGGDDAWLSSAGSASTLVALQRLHDKGYLSGRDFFRLGSAYQFFRRVEHRLQLRDGLQRHTLPEALPALDRLARRCGVDPTPARSAREQFLARLEQHFAEVREVYERILRPGSAREGTASPALPELAPGETSLLHRVRREFPGVARAIVPVLSSDDAYARRGLLRFLASAILDAGVMEQLEAHPPWVEHAAAIFSRSDHLTDLLCRNPEEIAAVADLGFAAAWTALPEGPGPEQAARPGAGEPEDTPERSLRVGYRRRVFAALVRGVIGASSPFDTLEVLSRLADDVLRRGLSIAAAEVLPVPLGAAEMPVAVIALGRLGTSEFDVNSDADLVFLADPALTPEDREPWRRIFERFVHLLGSHTKDGLLFPVDTRLRPRGGESDLLQSTAYLLDYCRAEARAWEAVTWLKARPVAGNFELGTAAIRDVRQILAERFSEPGALAADLAGSRQRLEDEAAANRGKGEFKKRAGGFYDVEYLLAFYFLCRGAAPLAAHTVRQIAALESAGVLDSATAQELRAAAFLYRAVDHAVRLITGHSARAVPEPALAARIAALFEAWRLPLPGAAGTPAERILGALAGTAERLRELYRRVLLQRAVPAAGPDGTRGSSGGTAGKVS